MSEQGQVSEQFTQSFAKVLNRHGYGFQFSILKKADELIKQRRSAWQLEACEFPVDVQGAGTRIDFVLQRAARFYHPTPLYLLAECKRANPALSNWCFVRAPYTHSNSWGNETDRVIMECVLREEDGAVNTFAREIFSSEKVYHIGFEVRSNIKGDNVGETGQAIENAATQISRGLNGFIETIVKNEQLLKNVKQVDFLPVIFTTAQLYVSDVDISHADLETGNITLADGDVKSVSWLFYQYSLSPGLKHSVAPKMKGNSIPTLLQWEFIRSIPIVSWRGVEDFLAWSSMVNLPLPIR